MKILEQSAREAGLAVDEIGIDKLMEQGKLTTDLVLPFFAKNLKELANNNDALTKALRENFQPALGRASNTLKDLANDVFQGGLKDGLIFVLNFFSDLGKESRGLAQALGSVLGGAVMGLTFPFKLLYAILVDISNLLGFEMNNDVLKLTASLLGAVAGAVLLGKALKVIAGTAGAIKSINNAMRGMGIGSDETGQSKDRRGRSSSGKNASKLATLGAGALGGAPVLAAAGTGLLLNEAGKQFASTDLAQESTRSMLNDLRARGSRFQNSNTMQRVMVDINMNQNAKEIIDARVNDGLQEQFDGVYNTMGSSKD